MRFAITRPSSCEPTTQVTSPSVVLPPAGGNVSQTDPDGAAGQVGPSTIFSSGQLMVSTQGTTGPTGSVTSSARIDQLNASGLEVLDAINISSTCTASETGVSGTTTITAGALRTDSGDDTTGNVHASVTVPVPTNPAANTTFLGHIHVNGAQENFRYVFNEEFLNPDGSITVNAAHQYLLGPTAVGDLIIGQVVCGVTAAPATTTTLPATTTTSSTTTILPATTTTLPATTTTSTLPSGPTCLGHPATIVGTEGNDRIFGTDGPDVIVGLGGGDSIYGLGGDDVICGGTGNDVIDGGEGNDLLDGQAGNDRVIGGLGDDDVRGGSGSDYVLGGDGNDLVDGGPDSPDYCYGGTGTNTFAGCEVYPAGT